MTKSQAKSSRATNVQVPGEQPKAETITTAAGTAETQNASAGSAQLGADPAFTGTAAGGETTTTSTPAIDIEALRAQIRAEERDNARRELGQQIEAASQVVGRSDSTGSAAAPRSKADYRNMRAADIDPATLTAPVMTRDGYLCPPAPEAKK